MDKTIKVGYINIIEEHGLFFGIGINKYTVNVAPQRCRTFPMLMHE
jgi:hypothetical protein